MTDYVKKIIDRYREETEIPTRSKVVSFRVTPDELDKLMQVFGDYTGIRETLPWPALILTLHKTCQKL